MNPEKTEFYPVLQDKNNSGRSLLSMLWSLKSSRNASAFN